MKQRVLITGGTGLIGIYLTNKLLAKGYEVAILSRTRKNVKKPVYIWEVEHAVIDQSIVNSSDYIIHLAGANIAEKRWSKKRKKIILSSRVDSCNLLFKALNPNKNQLKAFITASSIGYYGARTLDKIFVESDSFYNDFLGMVTKKWEDAANQFQNIGVRTVALRTGIVLSNKAKALKKLSLPIKLGLGASLGNGKQYIPWIHIEDLCNMYLKAIEDIQMQGAYNAVAPEYIKHNEWIHQLAERLNKKLWLPNIPAVWLQLILGELSDLVLKGSRISSDKIRTAGYQFLYPELKKALLALKL